MSKKTVVNRADRMEAAYLHQKLIAILYEEQLATLKLQEVGTKRLAATQELENHKNKLARKYKIDLQTHQVLEDGSIVPRPLPPKV